MRIKYLVLKNQLGENKVQLVKNQILYISHAIRYKFQVRIFFIKLKVILETGS